MIDGFRRQECLWNPQHFDYNNCCKKELYRQISAELLEELNYEMSGEDCYKELQKLRTRYRKELRMVIKHKGLYLPKLWCYDELEFLQKILQEQIFNKISKVSSRSRLNRISLPNIYVDSFAEKGSCRIVSSNQVH